MLTQTKSLRLAKKCPTDTQWGAISKTAGFYLPKTAGK